MPSNAYQLGLMVNTGRHLCMSTAYQKLTASWCRIRLQCKTQKTMKKWKRYLRNFVKSPCYPYCPAHEPRHEDATKSLLLAALASPSTLGDCSTVPPILKLKRKACPICWFSERFWTISSPRPRKRRGQSTPQTPAAVWETCQDRSCQFGTSSLEWYGWWPHGALRVRVHGTTLVDQPKCTAGFSKYHWCNSDQGVLNLIKPHKASCQVMSCQVMSSHIMWHVLPKLRGHKWHTNIHMTHWMRIWNYKEYKTNQNSILKNENRWKSIFDDICRF